MERKVIDEFSLAEVLTKDRRMRKVEDILWDAVEEELGRDQKKLMCLRDVLEAITKETRERDSLVMKLDSFNGKYCIDCLMCIQWNLYITDTLGPQIIFCTLYGGVHYTEGTKVTCNELARHVVSLLVML